MTLSLTDWDVNNIDRIEIPDAENIFLMLKTPTGNTTNIEC